MTLWLVTSTFYGQWLPGDARGSVSNVRDRSVEDPSASVRTEHACVGDEYERGMAGLERSSFALLKGPPISVNLLQAEQLLEQFQETAVHRSWTLLAVSIMFNHTHLVIGAPSGIDKKTMLRDFKSYGSRRLNRHFGTPASGTWWTDSGSCRPIRHLPSAIYYTCYRQPNPLVVWLRSRGRIPQIESDPINVYSEAFTFEYDASESSVIDPANINPTTSAPPNSGPHNSGSSK